MDAENPTVPTSTSTDHPHQAIVRTSLPIDGGPLAVAVLLLPVWRNTRVVATTDLREGASLRGPLYQGPRANGQATVEDLTRMMMRGTQGVIIVGVEVADGVKG